ncbi:ornithine cyclodeaminase family protein [Mycoplasma sp. P36-A1]|uniref:ornithine cyclodeaminase family protein n=1 Tax=Mycoplasma sp. P36-A1 TaxID=3252900 RepID=UPI003C2E4248
MLYLNKQTVTDLIDIKDSVALIEDLMVKYEEGNYLMPNRLRITRQDHNYLYMPYFSDEVKGSKIQTIFPSNREHQQPAIQGVVLLNNSESGKIECILDGSILTSMRTAAVAAAGIKYTTPETVESLGIIGAGIQSFYQVIFAVVMRPNISKIYIYDLSDEASYILKQKLIKIADDYASVAKLKDMEFILCDSSTDVVKQSELIITATYSQTPVIPNDPALFEGKYFVGIGSYRPDMREYPDALFTHLKNAYTDVYYAREESGDLIDPVDNGIFPANNIYTLGNVINGVVKPINTRRTTFFKVVGMAMFDVELANMLYKIAIEKNRGQEMIE